MIFVVPDRFAGYTALILITKGSTVSEIFNVSVAEYTIRASLGWVTGNPAAACGAVVFAGLVLALFTRYCR
jgi:hypothetical protein